MTCIKCQISESITPKFKYCRKCWAKLYYKKNKKRLAFHHKKWKYGENRIKALARDRYKCQECGENNKKLLVVHHLDDQGSTLPVEKQNNRLENLVTVCRSCHLNIHREKLSLARKEAFLKKIPKWSIKYEYCTKCREVERRHHSNGLCTLCFERTRKEYKKKWYIRKLSTFQTIDRK